MSEQTPSDDPGMPRKADPSVSASSVADPTAVTLADVARLSGVSPATATRALRGHPRVSPETRARVQAVARSLRYLPHLGARALATRSSRTIGLLIPSSGDGFWGEIAAGLEDRAAAEGFSTLLATSHGDVDRERRMIEVFLGQRVDGIVVGSAAGTPAAWFPGGKPATPLVLVDWDTRFDSAMTVAARESSVDATIRRIERQVRATPYPHVATDDVDGTSAAARHLLELGHREIAFAGLQPIRPSLLRLLGLRQALEAEGLRPVAVIACPPTLDGGEQAGRHIIEASRRPSAVVAFDDMVAVGVIRAAHAAGLTVPRDLSVVGFDDIEVAAFVEPPLTTVRQAKEALGSLALDVILAALRGGPGGGSALLRGELVVRQSAGRPWNASPRF